MRYRLLIRSVDGFPFEIYRFVSIFTLCDRSKKLAPTFSSRSNTHVSADVGYLTHPGSFWGWSGLHWHTVCL